MARTQDKENGKYQINKLYEQFKTLDNSEGKYAFEIIDTTVIGTKMIDSVANPRLTGAETFKEKVTQLINDPKVIRIRVIIFAGMSAKSFEKGNVLVYETEIPQGVVDEEPSEAKPQAQTKAQVNEQMEKMFQMFSEKLGLSNQNQLSGLGQVELSYARKEGEFQQQLLIIQHNNEKQRLEDKLERKDEKIQQLTEKIQQLEKENIELEKENDLLNEELADANETLKKAAPQKFVERAAIGIGAKALLGLADKKPKLKEALGALLDSFDSDLPDGGESSVPPPPPPPVVPLADAPPVVMSEQQQRFNRVIDVIAGNLRQLNGGLLKQFYCVYEYFMKNPSDLISYVNKKVQPEIFGEPETESENQIENQ